MVVTDDGSNVRRVIPYVATIAASTAMCPQPAQNLTMAAHTRELVVWMSMPPRFTQAPHGEPGAGHRFCRRTGTINRIENEESHGHDS
jgi:hypothetical protein